MYVLSKELNVSYEDMNNMPFFEILRLLEVYQENMKAQEKQNKKENEKMERQMGQMQKNYDFNNISRQINQNNSLSTPNYKMPNFNMNMPKI